MIKLESELLDYLGFDKPIEVNYDDVCEEYGGVPILENEHETRMWEEKGPVVSLQNFPYRTNPFWKMRYSCLLVEYLIITLTTNNIFCCVSYFALL